MSKSPARLVGRFLALFLSATLILPNPAFALRESQEDSVVPKLDAALKQAGMEEGGKVKKRLHDAALVTAGALLGVVVGISGRDIYENLTTPAEGLPIAPAATAVPGVHPAAAELEVIVLTDAAKADVTRERVTLSVQGILGDRLRGRWLEGYYARAYFPIWQKDAVRYSAAPEHGTMGISGERGVSFSVPKDPSGNPAPVDPKSPILLAVFRKPLLGWGSFGSGVRPEDSASFQSPETITGRAEVVIQIQPDSGAAEVVGDGRLPRLLMRLGGVTRDKAGKLQIRLPEIRGKWALIVDDSWTELPPVVQIPEDGSVVSIPHERPEDAEMRTIALFDSKEEAERARERTSQDPSRREYPEAHSVLRSFEWQALPGGAFEANYRLELVKGELNPDFWPEFLRSPQLGPVPAQPASFTVAPNAGLEEGKWISRGEVFAGLSRWMEEFRQQAELEFEPAAPSATGLVADLSAGLEEAMVALYGPKGLTVLVNPDHLIKAEQLTGRTALERELRVFYVSSNREFIDQINRAIGSFQGVGSVQVLSTRPEDRVKAAVDVGGRRDIPVYVRGSLTLEELLANVGAVWSQALWNFLGRVRQSADYSRYL